MGRPRLYRVAYPREVLERVLKLLESGKTITETRNETDVPRKTVRNWLEAANKGRKFVCRGEGELKADFDLPIEEMFEAEKEEKKAADILRDLQAKYRIALTEIDMLNEEVEHILEMQKPVGTVKIEPVEASKSEATAVIVASDWHLEEEVLPAKVGHLNEFNLDIAKERAERFWQNSLILLNLAKKDVDINNILLALLGDFISGSIHEDLMENNLLSPIDAVTMAQDLIWSGIDFLLENTDANLKIVCRPGNHSRITQRQRWATEDGNALESFMYYNLAKAYAGEDRVEVIHAPGYHLYVEVYDYLLRFHHGHAIAYHGGIGGLYIPVNRGIAQWNEGRRAYLDIFGHFHQKRDAGKFISNGSLIGYNPYAVSIKAEFEQPQQTFFLLDRDRGKTIVAPILVTRS